MSGGRLNPLFSESSPWEDGGAAAVAGRAGAKENGAFVPQQEEAPAVVSADFDPRDDNKLSSRRSTPGQTPISESRSVKHEGATLSEITEQTANELSQLHMCAELPQLGPELQLGPCGEPPRPVWPRPPDPVPSQTGLLRDGRSSGADHPRLPAAGSWRFLRPLTEPAADAAGLRLPVSRPRLQLPLTGPDSGVPGGNGAPAGLGASAQWEAPMSIETAPDSLVTDSLLLLTSPDYTPGCSLGPSSANPAGHGTLPATQYGTLAADSHVTQPARSPPSDISHRTLPVRGHGTLPARGRSALPPSDRRRQSVWSLGVDVSDGGHLRSGGSATLPRPPDAASARPERRRIPTTLATLPDPQTLQDPVMFVLRLWERTGLRTNGRRLLLNESELSSAVRGEPRELPSTPTGAELRPTSTDSHVYSEIAPDGITAPYLNQLIPPSSSASSARGSDGSSEGGSERRVTFSADTVDNEARSSRPRSIYEAHGLKPTRRPSSTAGDAPRGGFYSSNLITAFRSNEEEKDGGAITPKKPDVRVSVSMVRIIILLVGV